VEYLFERNHFSTEQQALDEIAARGWHALARDNVRTEDEPLHWHDFDAVLYLVSGIGFFEANGERIEAGPGCFALIPAGTLHREFAGTNCRLAFGFSVSPAAFTQPLNKPVETLEDFLRTRST